MTRTTYPRGRRVAAVTLSLGAALMALGYFAPSAGAAGGPPVFPAGYDSYLNANQRGIGPGDVGGGDCPEDASVDGMTAWHFVLSKNTHEFASLDVAFTLDGNPVDLAGLTPKTTAEWATFDPGANFIANPSGKHAYVYTESADGVVRDAAAQDSPDSAGPKFQLSHVCVGEDGGDDGTTDDGTTDDGTTDDGTTDDGTTDDGTTDDGTTDDGTTDDGTTDDGTTDDGTTDDGTTDDGTTDDGTTTDSADVGATTDSADVGATTTDGGTTDFGRPGTQVAGRQTLPATGAEDRSLMLLGGALIVLGLSSLAMRREAVIRS